MDVFVTVCSLAWPWGVRSAQARRNQNEQEQQAFCSSLCRLLGTLCMSQASHLNFMFLLFERMTELFTTATHSVMLCMFTCFQVSPCSCWVTPRRVCRGLQPKTKRKYYVAEISISCYCSAKHGKLPRHRKVAMLSFSVMEGLEHKIHFIELELRIGQDGLPCQPGAGHPRTLPDSATSALKTTTTTPCSLLFHPCNSCWRLKSSPSVDEPAHHAG